MLAPWSLEFSYCSSHSDFRAVLFMKYNVYLKILSIWILKIADVWASTNNYLLLYNNCISRKKISLRTGMTRQYPQLMIHCISEEIKDNVHFRNCAHRQMLYSLHQWKSKNHEQWEKYCQEKEQRTSWTASSNENSSNEAKEITKIYTFTHFLKLQNVTNLRSVGSYIKVIIKTPTCILAF